MEKFFNSLARIFLEGHGDVKIINGNRFSKIKASEQVVGGCDNTMMKLGSLTERLVCRINSCALCYNTCKAECVLLKKNATVASFLFGELVRSSFAIEEEELFAIRKGWVVVVKRRFVCIRF